MARTKIVHKLDRTQVKRMLQSDQRGLAKDMLKRGNRVKKLAARLVGVRSGGLRASLYVILIRVNGYPGAAVGSNKKYARFHHDGTGIYGPNRRRITPKTKKALKFTSKGTFGPVQKGKKRSGAGNVVIVKSVRGAPGTFFLKRALVAAKHK